jgi:hypothetical protein
MNRLIGLFSTTVSCVIQGGLWGISLKKGVMVFACVKHVAFIDQAHS